MTSGRPFLLLRIRFPGRPIFIQLTPGFMYKVSEKYNKKALFYASYTGMIGTEITKGSEEEIEKERKFRDRLIELPMDDAIYTIIGLALQKDSEFLGLFNHYIMKAFETGIFKRLFRNYHMRMYTREIFEMPEPQPLGPNNVMFCFLCPAFIICASLILVMVEFLRKKLIRDPIQ